MGAQHGRTNFGLAGAFSCVRVRGERGASTVSSGLAISEGLHSLAGLDEHVLRQVPHAPSGRPRLLNDPGGGAHPSCVVSKGVHGRALEVGVGDSGGECWIIA